MWCPRQLALGIVAVAIFGAGAGCSRRISPEDREQLSRARQKWEGDANAKRAAAEQREGLPSRSPMEAAEMGDVDSLRTMLAQSHAHRIDSKTLDRLLLSAAGSEPLVIGDDGQHGLDLRYGATAKILIQSGANIEARATAENGDTPLVRAAAHGETAVVKLLLQKGADSDAKNIDGQTALIAAACNCASVDMPDTGESVRLLLDAGADIEARDNAGNTALIWAAGWGRASILGILLDHGANIEAKDQDGNTALLIASRGSALPMADAVKVLLDRGADISARDSKGRTALDVATAAHQTDIVRLLKKRVRSLGSGH